MQKKYYNIETPYLDTENDQIAFYMQYIDQGASFTDDGDTCSFINVSSKLSYKPFMDKLSSIIRKHNVILMDGVLMTTCKIEEIGEKIKDFAICIQEVDKLMWEGKA